MRTEKRKELGTDEGAMATANGTQFGYLEMAQRRAHHTTFGAVKCREGGPDRFQEMDGTTEATKQTTRTKPSAEARG